MKLYGGNPKAARRKRLLNSGKATPVPRNPGHLTMKQRMQVRTRKIRLIPWYGALALAVYLLLLTSLVGMYETLLPALKGTSEAAVRRSDAALQMDFVGDVAMARNIRTIGERNGYDTIFSDITGYWKQSDLVFANWVSATLEKDVSAYTERDKNIHLYSDYSALDAALDAGVNVLACANNHAFDYGEEPIRELTDYLDGRKVLYSGIGRDLSEAASYKLVECGGVTIAYLSLTDVYYRYSTATDSQAGIFTMEYTDYNQLIYQAAREADVTIVYIYWGEENQTRANDTQKSLGRQLIDAGADIVVGSHTHVLQEVETYRDGIIFYSLGNFVFDQGNTYARDSVMVEYTADEQGNGSFRLYPVRINDGIPEVTKNHFYTSRINRCLTRGMAADSYQLDENGYVVIPYNISVEDGEDSEG